MSRKEAVVIFPTYKEYNQKFVALGHVKVFKGPFKHILVPFLNGIGGHIEAGETPLQAAWREFDEEVTVDISSLPTVKLLHVGLVDVTFLPEQKEVRLHVFRMFLPERVTITPKGTHEFDSFDWYPFERISHKIGPQGAALLHSDRFWLPHFLMGKGGYHAEIEITNQFHIYETGEGNKYKSGKVCIQTLKTPSE